MIKILLTIAFVFAVCWLTNKLTPYGDIDKNDNYHD
jgi:hypothetical protein